MNNIDAFLSMNHPKEKDAKIQEEIDNALFMQVADDVKDQPEAEVTTATHDPLMTLRELIASAPRKLKRKLEPEKKFGATLLARLKKK